MPDRLQKILSAHGMASRRTAEKLILEGRVTVNGIPALTGQSAEYGIDVIAVDGVPLETKAKPVYIMLNKPRGYLTTVKDDRRRRTVMELVTDLDHRVYPVGRLDFNTEGLLLLTNDGAFANAVAHPSFKKVKTYEVQISGDACHTAELLQQPVEIDGRLVRAASTELTGLTENGGSIKISIYEGRNRQIRKMCEACGAKVRTLKRVAIGTVKLGSLKTGRWRHLTADEHRSLLK